MSAWFISGKTGRAGDLRLVGGLRGGGEGGDAGREAGGAVGSVGKWFRPLPELVRGSTGVSASGPGAASVSRSGLVMVGWESMGSGGSECSAERSGRDGADALVISASWRGFGGEIAGAFLGEKVGGGTMIWESSLAGRVALRVVSGSERA